MTNDEKIDGMDAIIEDLVQWELSRETYHDLENFFYTKMKFYYYDNPIELMKMLGEKEEIEKAEKELDTPIYPITNNEEQWTEYFKGLKYYEDSKEKWFPGCESFFSI